MALSSSLYKKYDSVAINLIGVYDKVLEVKKGITPIPAVVEIFPTNFCNFACPHCRCALYHGTNKDYLPIGVFRKLLKELSEKGVNAIELSGGGEPLVHPNILEMFGLLKKYNFRVGTITNGYPLVGNKALQKRVLESSDWLRFSIDAFSEPVFKQVHGNQKISYTALTNTIKEMAVVVGNSSPKIELKMLISKLNVSDYAKGLDEARRLGVKQLQYKFLANSPIALSKEENDSVFTGLVKIKEVAEKEGIDLSLSQGYGGVEQFEEKCLMTFLHPVIDWDGVMYLCAFFSHRTKKHSIGNITKSGFFKLWFSKKHWVKFNSINPHECVVNCPMKRYNPVVKFIEEESYRFNYI